jgi:hypothetical protein
VLDIPSIHCQRLDQVGFEPARRKREIQYPYDRIKITWNGAAHDLKKGRHS